MSTDLAVVQPIPLAPRLAYVTDKLRMDPHLSSALDIQGGATNTPVSVVVAIRTTAGIVTGEFQIPEDKWDGVTFRAYWEAQERPS